MKIALNWIADYLAPLPAPQAAADALMNAGLPVESIEPFTSSPGEAATQSEAFTHILDVEVTSNRTDCLSHLGLARELAALPSTSAKFTEPTTSLTESGPAIASLTAITVQDSTACPYYSARLIRNVKVAPSPAWLVSKLESIGLRSINNVVDITNFVLMELGQPLHAFDFDKLSGKRIVVRRATKGESLLAIDGKSYPLDPSHLVIADDSNPQAIAGIMGGKNSEVTSSTTNILLESARFEPLPIRTASRALTLKSDSSYRFERGLDPTLAERASQRAAQLILEIAGGQLATGLLAVGSADHKPTRVTLRLSRIPKILGITIPTPNCFAILAALGFNPERSTSAEDSLTCTIPSHRLDVEREIDLIEEIARVHGYHHIPTLDRVSHSVQPEPPHEKAAHLIRQTLLAAGFFETINVTFLPKKEAEAFLPSSLGTTIPLAHSGWAGEVLRPSLLPSLLANRRTNQHAGTPDARIFEIAETFWQNGNPTTDAPSQKRVLALLGNSPSEIRGTLELLLQKLNPTAKLSVTPTPLNGYTPGVSGTISITVDDQSQTIGSLGQTSSDIQKHYDLRQPTYSAEVALDPLIALFQPVRRATPLPRFPSITRDLSIVLEESVRWSEIESTLKAAHLDSVESIDFVTTFRNKQIGDGKKSLTLTLTFRDPARTLKSEEVDTQMKSALTLLTEKFSAALRA